MSEEGAAARLTIDLDALAANHATLRGRVGGAETVPVVKADGYGLGARQVARRLWAEGARSFFVARLDEGERLRADLGAGRNATVYVLDGLAPGSAPRFRAAALVPVLSSLAQADEAAGEAGMETALHVDTGLNRLGVRPEQAAALAGAGRTFGMVMSHLACGPEPEHPMNARQLKAFREIAPLFPAARLSLANSAGVFLGADYHFDLVRPGISLYGGGPFEAPHPDIRPVVTFEAPVLQVRDVPAGESVGYGAHFVARRTVRSATVAAGHADGMLRSLQPGGFVWFRGERRPILGQVSMDVIVVDVTGCEEVRPGEMVELLGPNALIDEVAAAAGTISYEFLVRLSGRARRTYLGEASA